MTEYTTKILTKQGLQEITVYRTNNDINGNPRYVVHFLSLDVEMFSNGTLPSISYSGMKKYRGKDFGGGYVFQSYNIKDSLQRAYDLIHDMDIATIIHKLEHEFGYRETEILKDCANIERNYEVPKGYHILRFYDSKGNGFECGKTPNGYSITN